MVAVILPPPPRRPGAVLYAPDAADRDALRRFAETLKTRGFRVGGLIQEGITDPATGRAGVDGIELDTGRRLPLSRPVDANCGLDRAVLAEATGALRRALAERHDLMVVVKFGEREAQGEGLADEILAAMAESLPTLVALPVALLDAWQRFSGGLAELLPSDDAALWRWWGPHRLYPDLRQAVPADAGPVRRVVVGPNWTLVEGPAGCGIAQTPPRERGGCRPLDGAGALTGRPLADLAGWAGAVDPLASAIGVAALNAHLNRADLKGTAANGLDDLAAADGPVVSVGRFPRLPDRCQVVDRHPRDGEFPEAAAGWLVPTAEATAITASSLVDGTLPGFLAARGFGTVSLVGPGTPLTRRLHAYGLDTLAGLVIDDAEGAARTVAEGGGASALKRHGRPLVLDAGTDREDG